MFICFSDCWTSNLPATDSIQRKWWSIVSDKPGTSRNILLKSIHFAINNLKNCKILQDINASILLVHFNSYYECYIPILCSHLTKIFVEAYNVLYTYLMGDSRKNELYIAKYIDFFLSQFELKEVSWPINIKFSYIDKTVICPTFHIFKGKLFPLEI